MVSRMASNRSSQKCQSGWFRLDHYAAGVDLQITLDPRTGHTAGIYRQVLDAVLDGRLRAGERLPSSRDLAGQLQVARGTVNTAYERLIAEGFLTSRRGSGTYVCEEVKRSRSRRARGANQARPRSHWEDLAPGMEEAPPLEFDLSIGGPDPGLFPLSEWRRMVGASLGPGLTRRPIYSRPGHAELQSEIARYLGQSRSVHAEHDDVLLTAGAQQGLDLCSRVLLAPGDRVAVEDPGYTAAVRLFRSHRATVSGVPVDEEGLVVDQLPPSARLVYVTPSHQFPTGAVMSLRRRVALLEWAARHGAVVVEDDYDSEFRYADRPLEPLQSLDPDGRVIYVGSFSKTLSPMLRAGYLVAPLALQPSLRQAKQLTDWQGDVVTQGALARFMAEGRLAPHLRRAIRAYRQRREVLSDTLAGHPDLDPLPSAAGLHVCARFVDPDTDDETVAAHAARAGVAIEPLSPRFVEQPSWPGLLLGFRHITADRIPEAIRRLPTLRR